MLFETDFLKNDEIYLVKYKTIDETNLRGFTPYYKFKIYLNRDNCEIGNCIFRVGNDFSLYYIGNISFHIDDMYRGNKFCEKTCTLLFELAKKHKMDYVLISCSSLKDSCIRTCKNLGGSLEKIAKLPLEHPLYLRGERERYIYKFTL